MATGLAWTEDESGNALGRSSDTAASQRSSALANKLSSVLSASFADPEIRDALQSLDDRNVKNTPRTRRQLRLDVQKDVIAQNSKVIQEFGQVAEVCLVQRGREPSLKRVVSN